MHDATLAETFKIIQLLFGLGRGEGRVLAHVQVGPGSRYLSSAGPPVLRLFVIGVSESV